MEQNSDSTFNYDKRMALIAFARMMAGDFSIVRKPNDGRKMDSINHVGSYLLDVGDRIQSIDPNGDRIDNINTVQEVTNDFIVISKLAKKIIEKGLYPENTGPEDLDRLKQLNDDIISIKRVFEDNNGSRLGSKDLVDELSKLQRVANGVFDVCQKHISDIINERTASDLFSQLGQFLEEEAKRNGPEKNGIGVKEDPDRDREL